MKINVNEIPKNGLIFEKEINGENIDVNREDLHFIWPIQIVANVSKDQDNILINIDYNSKIKISCARCLLSKEQFVKKHIDYRTSAQLEKQIDLLQIIREDIILEYPIKLLCREDCLGLCPRCGTDLNRNSCNCANEENSDLGTHLKFND